MYVVRVAAINEHDADGYQQPMTTAPLEPVGDPDLTPEGPNPVAPGSPDESEQDADPEES